MFLLNCFCSSDKPLITLFTIQNVSIKLNDNGLTGSTAGTFTIQNVSIKLSKKDIYKQNLIDLQYKMFLLNEENDGRICESNAIYNTKCFY